MTKGARGRAAVPSDVPAVVRLMRASVLGLFPSVYGPAQVASAVRHVACLDERLIADGTFVVYEAEDEIIACGGWSRRAKLFSGAAARDDDERILDPAREPARVRSMFVRPDRTRRGLGRAVLEDCLHAAAAEGFRSVTLMATLPGEPLYRKLGFEEVERRQLRMPDGVLIEGVEMRRGLHLNGHRPQAIRAARS